MVNEKTSWVFDQDTNDGKDKDRSLDFSPSDRRGSLTESLSEATVDVSQRAKSDHEATQVISRASLSERTVIFSPATEEMSKRDDTFAQHLDPVVGWLVILNGPGKGRSMTLGHGLNQIGRGADQRVSVDFGDTLISTVDHAKILYEDGEFYIAHGSGKNLTKLNGKLIPNMVPLEDRAIIQLSKNTTCIFVGLCGPSFDWSKA